MDEQEFFNKIKELQKQRDLLKKDVTVLECWQEMQKHQPFGWVKYANKYIFISAIDSNNDYANIIIRVYFCLDSFPLSWLPIRKR